LDLQRSPASEPSFYKCYTKTPSITCHCSHQEEARTPVLLREEKKKLRVKRRKKKREKGEIREKRGKGKKKRI
jgi:hypothetical protein